MKDKNLFNIGEASAALGITPRTLRHYEEKGLIKPGNTDKQTGYRYYDAQDIQNMLLVMLLRDAGMSVEEVAMYIKKAVKPQEQIARLRRQLSAVQQSIDLLKTHMAIKDEYEPRRVKLPRRICVCKDFIMPSIEAFFSIYRDCTANIIREGWALSREYPNFCEYPPEAFDENGLILENFPVKICVPVKIDAPFGDELPEGTVLYPEQDSVTVDFRGGYEDLYRAYEAAFAYMSDHKLAQDGNTQEIYFESFNTAFDKGEYLTRVIIPVKKS